MDVQQQKLILEDNVIKVNQDDILKMRDKLLITKKDFVLFEVLYKKQKGKIGNIHKATLRGEEVLCKVIELERVNNFQIEAFLELQCILQ